MKNKSFNSPKTSRTTILQNFEDTNISGIGNFKDTRILI